MTMSYFIGFIIFFDLVRKSELCNKVYMILVTKLVHYLLLLLFVSLLATPVHNKLYSRDFKSVQLKQNKSWIYLDRMRISPGTSTVNFWAYLQTETMPAQGRYQLTLQIVPEQLWQRRISERCQLPQQSSKSTQPPKSFYIHLPLNPSNRLSATQSLTLSPTTPTTFYFALSDCSRTLVNEYFNKKSRFDIEVDIIDNGHNYGVDESIYLWLIPLLICITGGFVKYFNVYGRNRDQNQDVNWALVIVKIGVWSRLFALFFWYFGIVVYVVGRGTTYGFFGFAFLILSTFQQALMLILLTFCAYGWMTTFQVNDNEQIYYPIASVFGFLSVVLSLLSKINDGQPTKYHLYDSIPTLIQQIVKIVSLIILIIGIVLSSIKFKKNPNIKQYMMNLLVFGSVCFLSQPAVVWYLESFGNKHQLWVDVFVIVEIVRTLQLAVLVYQVANKKSMYNKVTLHDRSFMQSDDKFL